MTNAILLLFGSFAVMMALGVPIAFAIGISAAVTFLLFMGFDQSMFIVAQQMASGLDSFTLLAIPFFILAGNIMNRGGIAGRLIDLAKVLAGRLPGSLAHVNIIANMLFGSISGSAVASAAAVGGVMAPVQKREGYDPAFSTAVNVASCPTGLLIPPSTTLIVYSLITGGTSIGATSAVVPRMPRMLKMLLPTMLPTAMSRWPLIAAMTLVATSGREVPAAMMVRPMTSSERPRAPPFLAKYRAVRGASPSARGSRNTPPP